MKKRTLQEAKELLYLWHLTRAALISEMFKLSDSKIKHKSCICGAAGVFGFKVKKIIKDDLFNQSLEFFSPEFRGEVMCGRSFGNSLFLFKNDKNRLKFVNSRIDRLKAEILKLQSNE